MPPLMLWYMLLCHALPLLLSGRSRVLHPSEESSEICWFLLDMAGERETRSLALAQLQWAAGFVPENHVKAVVDAAEKAKNARAAEETIEEFNVDVVQPSDKSDQARLDGFSTC